MDSFELNKIAGAVLFAILVAFGISILSEIMFERHAPEEPAYVIAIAEPGEGGGAGAAEEGPDFATLLASADPAVGERNANKCTACHTFEKGGADKVGPHLWDVVGRPIAGVEGFSYSAGMVSFSEGGAQVWDYDHLSNFLHDPRGTVPGTKMSFAGLKRDDERAAMVAYLRTLSDNPQPLPEATAAAAPEGEAAPAEGKAAAPAEGEQAAAPAEGATAPAADDATAAEAPAAAPAAPAPGAATAPDQPGQAGVQTSQTGAQPSPQTSTTAPDQPGQTAAPDAQGASDAAPQGGAATVPPAVVVPDAQQTQTTTGGGMPVAPQQESAPAAGAEPAAPAAPEGAQQPQQQPAPAEQPAAPAPQQEGTAPAAPAQQQAAPAQQQAAAPAEQPAAAGEASGMAAMVAAADIAVGERSARKCAACHSFNEGGPNKVGPNLWDRFGQPIAVHEGYNYSPAMKEFSNGGAETWTIEHLDAFLLNPKAAVPGTKMAFPGIRNDDERAALIAYMHSLSANPEPLAGAQ
ncbi:c-type cytochrome [Faunimonas sp. B44]|uniref:c-type cytochrome n=1 Tax=Faunimonas sp. B44 TaxID=3461493 RepID=UPI004044794C